MEEAITTAATAASTDFVSILTSVAPPWRLGWWLGLQAFGW